MTNYRVDRIGTHRHASDRIDTKFDHIDTAKQGHGYESIVSRYEYWANGHWYEQQLINRWAGVQFKDLLAARLPTPSLVTDTSVSKQKTRRLLSVVACAALEQWLAVIVAHQGINDSLSFSVWTIAHAWSTSARSTCHAKTLTSELPTPELV